VITMYTQSGRVKEDHAQRAIDCHGLRL